MKFSQQVRLPVSRRDAWMLLNDVSVLQPCIPGCELFRAVSPDEFDVTITVPMGLTDVRLPGKIRLRDVDPARSYTLQVESAAGQGQAEARVQLESSGENETLLRYTARITVGGLIATFGAPLWNKIARRLAQEFFKAFVERIRQPS